MGAMASFDLVENECCHSHHTRAFKSINFEKNLETWKLNMKLKTDKETIQTPLLSTLHHQQASQLPSPPLPPLVIPSLLNQRIR